MLNVLIASQGLKAPTGVLLTSTPDPPNGYLNPAGTTYTVHVDADPINHTFVFVAIGGTGLSTNVYLAPGVTSADVATISPGGGVSAPYDVTCFVSRTNQNTRNGWPRSPETESNTISVLTP